MSKYYTFYRENNNFDDILTDQNIKKVIHTKTSWYQHLMIGIMEDGNEGTFSYITLKYGDDMKKPDVIDRTPIPGIDYIPKQDKSKFSKRVQ